MRESQSPRGKMANHDETVSLAQELWQAICPPTYRGIVPYIGKSTALKPSEFDDHELNDRYWLDTRNCKHGRKINRQQIFELFGSYSGENPADVRQGMVMKIRLEYDFFRGVGMVMTGTGTLDTWMDKMSKPDVAADELAIYALSRFFNRHTLIYTKMRPWTTLAPEHSTSVETAHDKCQTHLVYLGNNMYGVLRPRPFVNVDAPMTLDEVLNPMIIRKTNNPTQQEPLNLTVALPTANEALDTGIVPDHFTNSENITTADADVTSPELPDDPTVPEVGAETTVLSDSQEDSEQSSFEQPVRTAAFCRAVEDARDKHLKVKLEMLTNAELEKYLNVKTDNTDTNKDNEETYSTPDPQPGTSQGSRTSRYNPVNYAESSASEGGAIHGDSSDSDWSENSTPSHPKTAAMYHGPSTARMAAQKLILATKSSTRIKPKTDVTPASSSGSSRTHSPDSAKSIGKQGSSKPAAKPKRKGVLSIKTHGLKKSKKDRTFSCKECNYRSDCVKLMNEHHIEEHDPVPCAECDHVSSTPSSHARHMYKHKHRDLACDDCYQKFAFKSELRAHKYSHRTERSFECMAANCNKTFKSDSELQKHVKIHEGNYWYCDCCTYKTPDVRNLQKHMVIHTEKLPHVCARCGKRFRWYEQMKRHYKNKSECPSN